MVRVNRTNSFNSTSLTNISHEIPNSEPIDDKHVVSKCYVDSLFGKDMNRRAISIVMNAQNSDFNEYKLTNSGSSTPNRNPILEEEAAKKHVQDELDKNSIVRDKKNNDFTDNNLTDIDSISVNNISF